jgi:hypothetical protein
LLLPGSLLLAASSFPASARADSPNEDVHDPVVEIVDPADQANFEGAPASITVSVSADDEDFPSEPASGVETVTLSVDGMDVATLDAAPYTFENVALAEGMHELVARAVDGSGNEGTSPTIHVVVFPADGETGGDGDGSGGGDDGGDGDASSKGCSVSPAQTRNAVGSALAFAFAVLSASMLRKRRR